MPCIHDGPEDRKTYKVELDEVTALLCEAMGILQENCIDISTSCSETLQWWWQEHKKADKLRIERELTHARNIASRAEFAFKDATRKVEELEAEQKMIQERK